MVRTNVQVFVHARTHGLQSAQQSADLGVAADKVLDLGDRQAHARGGEVQHHAHGDATTLSRRAGNVWSRSPVRTRVRILFQSGSGDIASEYGRRR